MTTELLGLAAGVSQPELELGYPEWLVYLATLLIIFLAYQIRNVRGRNKKPENYLHSTQKSQDAAGGPSETP